MDVVHNPFQQLEAAKRQLIMEFKENAKSAQEFEFWKRMETVRDNYQHSQEDSSSGDTTDEEQDEEENIYGAGDDTHLPQKDFIFQSDGMEHDFNHNATRCENDDSNGQGALQLTEDKLAINDNKKVSAEKVNDYKVGIKELFKAAKKTAKMEAKESEKKRKMKEIEEKKKRKMKARETQRKGKLQENEIKKMKMEAEESKEKKLAREEKKIKKKRKIDKKKAKNQKKYEKCVAKGDEQKRKQEIKSLHGKYISQGEAKPVKTPKLMNFVRSLVGCFRNRH